MTELISKVALKLKKTYLKLLKAEAKHKVKKVQKLEKKIIELELKLKLKKEK